jgi:hypothetical protein
MHTLGGVYANRSYQELACESHRLGRPLDIRPS